MSSGESGFSSRGICRVCRGITEQQQQPQQLWQCPSLQLNPWLSFRHPQDPETSREERNAGALWCFFQSKTAFSEKKINPTALGSEHTSTIHKGNPLLSLESWELMALTGNFCFSELQCNPSPVTHKTVPKVTPYPKSSQFKKQQPNQTKTEVQNILMINIVKVLPAKPFPVFFQNLERLPSGTQDGNDEMLLQMPTCSCSQAWRCLFEINVRIEQ